MMYGEPPTDPPPRGCDKCGVNEENDPFAEYVPDENLCTLCSTDEEYA